MTEPTAPRRILVVDDDARVRHAIGQLIDRTPGLRLAAAVGTADEAAQTSDVDLAVVDVRLPDPESGLDLVRRLSARIPVIAISFTGSLATPAGCAGATAFCDKDGDTDALIDTIFAALGDGFRDGRSN